MIITTKFNLCQCHICDEKLRGNYLFFQNKPICDRDFQVHLDILSFLSAFGDTPASRYIWTSFRFYLPLDSRFQIHLDILFSYHTPSIFQNKPICDRNFQEYLDIFSFLSAFGQTPDFRNIWTYFNLSYTLNLPEQTYL